MLQVRELLPDLLACEDAGEVFTFRTIFAPSPTGSRVALLPTCNGDDIWRRHRQKAERITQQAGYPPRSSARITQAGC